MTFTVPLPQWTLDQWLSLLMIALAVAIIIVINWVSQFMLSYEHKRKRYRRRRD
ncbi:MAG: hypothetical protein Phog2KO_22100 [Phototrophicaceae bacterium]